MPDRSGDHRPPREGFCRYGFIPLGHCKGRITQRFFATQSPKSKENTLIGKRQCAAFKLSFSISSPFPVSAHYLKSMMRDKVGSCMSRSQAEDFLNRSGSPLRDRNDSASQDTKAVSAARSPRRCREIPESPDGTVAVAFCGRTSSDDSRFRSGSSTPSSGTGEIILAPPSGSRRAGNGSKFILAHRKTESPSS